jgi:hypothetical protein
MAGIDTVRATITRATDGWYTLTVCIRENGRSRVLIEKPAASVFRRRESGGGICGTHPTLVTNFAAEDAAKAG